MRAVIIGSSGQLGTSLLRVARPGYECVAADRTRVDIADAESVDSLIGGVRPHVVFNAAAFTNVDGAEADAATAFRVNADGAAHVARAAARHGAHVVHVSTDYVFDGARARPYLPTDATCPLGVYGRSKLAGEGAVLSATDGAGLVVRTAWLYSSSGRNFLLTMLRVMRACQTPRVVFDQIGTPTPALALARALWRAADVRLSGIHHWTQAGTASWYDFAAVVAEEAYAAKLVPAPPSVVPIVTSEWPGKARRPPYSVLDCRGTWDALGAPGAHWHAGVRETIRELSHG